MLNDKEFIIRKQLTLENRIKLIRSWLAVVEIYFLVRSGFIIWPKYYSALEAADDNNDVDVFEEAIQSFLAVVVIAGVCYSYFNQEGQYLHIRFMLFIQGV